jgi:hypothetical protein
MLVGVGRLMERVVHAGAWSVLLCGSAAPPPPPPTERDYPLAKGSNNTHAHKLEGKFRP